MANHRAMWPTLISPPKNFFIFFVGHYSVALSATRRRKSLVAPRFESGSEAIFTEYCPRESDSIILGGALLVASSSCGRAKTHGVNVRTAIFPGREPIADRTSFETVG